MRTILFISFLVLNATAFADGDGQVSSAVSSPQVQATLDPRLPPVIPGETMNRNGRKIRVITTAGSVGGRAPASPPAPDSPPLLTGRSGQPIDHVDVIVDGRKSESKTLQAPTK